MAKAEGSIDPQRQAGQQQHAASSSHRGSAYMAATVFITLLAGLQAMSYIFRVSQGDLLPEHRKKHWHGLQFLSDAVGHSWHHTDTIHEDYFSHRVAEADPLMQHLTSAYNTLMNDPSFKNGLEEGQTELDLDVGMDEEALQEAEDAISPAGWQDGESEIPLGGDSRTAQDTLEDGAASSRAAGAALSSGAQELPDRDWLEERGELGGPREGIGSDAVAYAAELHDGVNAFHALKPLQASAAASVAAAASARAAAEGSASVAERRTGDKADAMAEISLGVPLLRQQWPRTIVTKQKNTGSEGQDPASVRSARVAPAAIKPAEPKQDKAGDSPKSRPRRGRLSHADRIARIVKRLYRDKKVYTKFNGHVAMSKQSLPPTGNAIRTPWKIIPTGEWRTLGKVSSELLSVLPATDVVGSHHYKTCAVVGSAGILLTQEYGPEIDAHDCVIRFNIAPTKGFEKHAGEKTTIRFVNRLHFGYRETPKETVLQHVTMPDMMNKFVSMMKKNRGMPTYPFDTSFYEQMIEWHRVQQPTNGFFGMKLALHMCDRIDVYGFVRNWRGNFKYHYFNKEEPNAQQFARDNGGELPLIKELMQKHQRRLFFKHPCILSKDCEGCPSVAHCEEDVPFPVPKTGFCRKKGSSCWLRCDSCPGGKKGEFCPSHVTGTCES